MDASIKRMGNSAAILLPKPVLAHLQVSTGDVLSLDLQEGRVVLSPRPRRVREGWAEAAEELAKAREDSREWIEFGNGEDMNWTW